MWGEGSARHPTWIGPTRSSPSSSRPLSVPHRLCGGAVPTTAFHNPRFTQNGYPTRRKSRGQRRPSGSPLVGASGARRMSQWSPACLERCPRWPSGRGDPAPVSVSARGFESVPTCSAMGRVLTYCSASVQARARVSTLSVQPDTGEFRDDDVVAQLAEKRAGIVSREANRRSRLLVRRLSDLGYGASDIAIIMRPPRREYPSCGEQTESLGSSKSSGIRARRRGPHRATEDVGDAVVCSLPCIPYWSTSRPQHCSQWP